MKRVLLSWSSGKDSAWTLHVLRRDLTIELVGLLTTLNTEFQRVAMHGTRRSVLEAQAAAAELPLWIIPLPWPCTNEIYEQRMADACNRAIEEHIDAVAFGDLFLADVRAYREKQLKPTGLEPLFPLWEIPTDKLAREMIAGGLRFEHRAACAVHGHAVEFGVERGQQANQFDGGIAAQNVQSPCAVFAAAPGEKNSLHVGIINCEVDSTRLCGS